MKALLKGIIIGCTCLFIPIGILYGIVAVGVEIGREVMADVCEWIDDEEDA